MTGSRALALFAASLLLPFAPAAMPQVVPWATTLAPSPDAATIPEDRGADGLAQTLNKLRTWGSLMMIVAHPDDEDGGMLTYESRGVGIRTSMLTLTRGEGGQNAMTGDTYDALGLMRTNELLAADRYSGTEQMWGSEADFGFSKTKEEAFAKWTHDRVLRDVVRAVREQRPLILTSVFLGGVTDGHGHHQVAGELAQEAFNAAGDPHVFPDQIAAGLLPWKPLAVYERVPFAPVTARGMYDYATDSWAPPSFTNYVTGVHSTTPPTADVSIPEGQWDPVLGRSYLQMAREGWGLQKSQYGGGTPPLAGPDNTGYHLYATRDGAADKGAKAEASNFFSGIDISLPGMTRLAQRADSGFVHAGLLRMQAAATQAFWGYTPGTPDRVVPYLLEFYRATAALREAVAASGLSAESKANLAHELNIKLVQCNTALVEALGLQLDAVMMPDAPTSASGQAGPQSFTLNPPHTRAYVTPGEDFEVRLHITAPSPWSSTATNTLQLVRSGVITPTAEHWQAEHLDSPGLDRLQSNVAESLFRVTVPSDAAPTAPYFTRPSNEQPYYDIADPSLAGRSFAPYPVSGYVEFSDAGVPIRIAQVVQTEQRELGRGDYRDPLVVTPRLSVSVPETVAVLPWGAKQLTVPVSVSNQQSDASDLTLQLDAPAGWRVEPASYPVTLQPGEQETRSFTAVAPPDATGTVNLQAEAHSGNYTYKDGFRTVGYPGLRPYNLYRQASLQVRRVPVTVAPGTRVAYVMGTGDSVPAALRAIGVPVDVLTPADLSAANLQPYSTVMLGVRAYTADPGLAADTARLKEFAESGGTVVVQYQSSDFAAPFPLHLGNTPARVVDERSPVALLDPANALMRDPNPITADDFNGWVEERGHGFAASWGPQWTPLFSTADPEQPAQRGGLLVAQVGKGRYIYCALALYRQVTEGVPGGYRLLANLVSARR